ncbi:MAG: S41 family peptidase [Acidimicrobiales bacterium]
MKRTTNLFIAASISSALLAAACGDGTEITIGDQPDIEAPSVSVASVADDRDTLDSVTDESIRLPDGWYEMDGYGTVLHVDGDDITSHYVTTSTCVVGGTVENELPVDHAEDDGVITLNLIGQTTDYRLLPLTGPLDCDSSEADTLLALDELFTAHYPFFDERGFDWPAAMSELRTAVEGDPDAFETAFAELLIELGDGHTTVEGVDIDPDVDAFGLTGVTTLGELEAGIGTEFDRTVASVDDITADATGSVAWGHLDAGTGYLMMVAFHGISADDDAAADLAALRTALDEAIADLDDVDRLVVDMRFNGGGYDDLAAVAAGYFVDDPTPAYRKWAHAQPDAFVQTVVIEPEAAFFEGAVAVVTSPITASAAEVFTLAMTEVADAAVVGSPSFGEFSDAIDWVLPDGTEFTLSMENYTDLDGANHEATGIPVDVPAPFDQAIAAAIDHLAAT